MLANYWWRRLALASTAALVSAVVVASSQAGADARTASSRRATPGVACRTTVHTIPSDVNLTSDLAGVAVTSPCNAWAVGSNLNETLVEHWNGRNWKQVPSPNAPTRKHVISNSGLNGVAASSFRDAWAVGSTDASFNETFLFEHTLIEHWNGTRWSREHSPNPGKGQNENSLEAVATTPHGGAWAVGWFTNGQFGTYHTLILRWAAGSWAQVPSPTPLGAFNLVLTGVRAISSSDAWAVGYYTLQSPGIPYQIRTLIEHWDGNQWTIVPSPDPAGHRLHSFNQLNAVAGSARGVWAVGTYGRPHTRAHALIESWNGTTWTQVPSVTPPGRNPAVELSGVTVLPSGHAWAVGGYGSADPFDSGHGGRTLIEYWNGLRWNRVPSPSRPQKFSFSSWTAVATASPGKVMAVGVWICRSTVEPLAARLIRGSWRFIPTPNVNTNNCPI